MRKYSSILALALLSILYTTVTSGSIMIINPYILSDNDVPPLASSAFPGAEGFGTDTRGAYELYEQTLNPSDLPTIYHVTSLANSGTGTLRAALEASGPRIVVFDTGGIITLTNAIKVPNPYLTVAGQTAPGDGITTRGGPIFLGGTHDVIFRGMRLRPTQVDSLSPDWSYARRGLWIGGPDTSYDNPVGYNMVIDHCSLSWTEDEAITIWAGAENITVSNNLIYQPVDNASHNYGVMPGPGSIRISYHHNILSHSKFRNPMVGGTREHDITWPPTSVEVINNVVYNGRNWTGLQISPDSAYGGSLDQEVVVAGEYHKAGVDLGTTLDNYVFGAAVTNGSSIYLPGNLSPRRQSHTPDDWYICSSGGSCNSNARVESWPFAESGITISEASANYDYLIIDNDGMTGSIPNAGAYPRDIIDTIAIEQIQSGTAWLGTDGAWGSGPNDMSSCTSDWRNNQTKFPCYSAGTPPTDSDGDGMPASFESSIGTSDSDPTDAHDDEDSDGYYNIEEYINSFFE